MSKNLTRKSLAFGALVALGTSVIAGAPANAAGETITLASAYGTGTKTLIGSTFDLSSTFVGWGAAPTKLAYFVTGATAAELTATSGSTTDHSAIATSISDADTTGSEATGVEVPVGATTLGNYADLRLGLASSVTATRTITVTAFNDSVVTNGVIDAGEVASAPVSVTWVKPSEATAVTTLDKPVVGSATVTAHVTLGDINLQQVTAGVVRIALTKNGSVDTGNGNASGNAAAWVKDDAALSKTFTLYNSATVASTDVLSAQAYILDAGQTNVSGTYSKVGSASALASADANSYEVSVGDITAVDKSVVSGGAIRAKTTTAIAFKSEVKVQPAAAADYAAPAGIPAKVVITATSLGTTTLTVGGKTIKAGDAALTVKTVTDATGYVNFTVTADKAIASESFSAQVFVADKTAATGFESSASVTYTYRTAVETKVVAAVNGNNVIGSVKGSTVSVGVSVYDQFGQLFSSTDGFKVFATSASNSVGAAVSAEAAVTAGKATVSFVNNATTTGTYNVGLVLKEWNTTSSIWDATIVDDANTTDISAIATLDIRVVDSVTAATVTGTLTAGTLAIDTADFKDADARTGAAAPAITSANQQTIAGSVLAADGSGIPGVPVTLTAAGVQFNAGDVWSVGSITVNTDSTGAYSVKYSSHLKGKASIVVTSGAATKTVEGADLATPNNVSAISKIVVSGSTSLLPGRSVIYTVSLVDKFGNPVEDNGAVKVSYTGPGYFTTDLSSIANFSDKGTLSLTLITGATDAGAGTLTVTSFGPNDSQSSDANKKDDIVLATTITVAAAAAPVAVEPTSKIGTANSRVYVNVKDGKGSVVSVKIGAKWYTKTSLNNDYTFSFKAKAKSKVSVKVYVDGDLSSSKTIIVKK